MEGEGEANTGVWAEEVNPGAQQEQDVHDAVANSDLLREVFKNLDTCEISRATCVCRTWRAVADSPQFWESLVCLDRLLTYDQAVRIIRRHCLSLRVMRLGYKAVPASLFESPSFKQLLTRLVRLTELKLSGLTLQEQALTALSGPAAIPSLKLLVLDDVTLTNPGDLTLTHSAVETVQLKSCKLGRATFECVKLQSLSLAGSYVTTLACQACPQLKALDLKGLSKIRDTDLRATLTRLTTLTSLHLNGVASLVEDTLREAIPLMPGLELLSLAGCGSAITLAGLRGANALRKLHLEGCEGISGPTLQPALASCGSVHEVWLDKCSHLTALNLDGHPSLRLISARGCRLLATVDVRCKRVTMLLVGQSELGGAGCPALRTITLASDDVESITWSNLPSLESVQLDCPNLSYLAFIDCDSLTDAAISGLSDSLSQPPTIQLASVPATSSARAAMASDNVGSSASSASGRQAALGSTSGAGAGGSGVARTQAPQGPGSAAGRSEAPGSFINGSARGGGSGAGSAAGARTMMQPGGSRAASRGRGRGAAPPPGAAGGLRGPPGGVGALAGPVGGPPRGPAQASAHGAGVFGVPPVRTCRGVGAAAGGAGPAVPATAPAGAAARAAGNMPGGMVLRLQPTLQAATPATAPAGPSQPGPSMLAQQPSPSAPTMAPPGPGTSHAVSGNAAGNGLSRRQPTNPAAASPSSSNPPGFPSDRPWHGGGAGRGAAGGGRDNTGRGELRSRSWDPHRRRGSARAAGAHSVHSCSSTDSEGHSSGGEDGNEEGPWDMRPPPSKHRRLGHLPLRSAAAPPLVVEGQPRAHRRRPGSCERQQQPRSGHRSTDAAGLNSSPGQAQGLNSQAGLLTAPPGTGMQGANGINPSAAPAPSIPAVAPSVPSSAPAPDTFWADLYAEALEDGDEMVIDLTDGPGTSGVHPSSHQPQGLGGVQQGTSQPTAGPPASTAVAEVNLGSTAGGVHGSAGGVVQQPSPLGASGPAASSPQLPSGGCWRGLSWLMGSTRGSPAKGTNVAVVPEDRRARGVLDAAQGCGRTSGGAIAAGAAPGIAGPSTSAQATPQHQPDPGMEGEGDGGSFRSWRMGRWRRRQLHKQAEEGGREGEQERSRGVGSQDEATERIMWGMGRPGHQRPSVSGAPAPQPAAAAGPSQAQAQGGHAQGPAIMDIDLEYATEMLPSPRAEQEDGEISCPSGTMGGSGSVPASASAPHPDDGSSRRPGSPGSARMQSTRRPPLAKRPSGREEKQEVRGSRQLAAGGITVVQSCANPGAPLGDAGAGALLTGTAHHHHHSQAHVGPPPATTPAGSTRPAGTNAKAGPDSGRHSAPVTSQTVRSAPGQMSVDRRVDDVISLVSSCMMQRGQASGNARGSGSGRGDAPPQQQGNRHLPGPSSRAPAATGGRGLAGGSDGPAGPHLHTRGVLQEPGSFGRRAATLHRQQPPPWVSHQQHGPAPAQPPASHALMDLEPLAQVLDMEDAMQLQLIDYETGDDDEGPAPMGWQAMVAAGHQAAAGGGGGGGGMAAAPAALAVVLRHTAHAAATAAAAAAASQTTHNQVAYTPVHGVPRLRTLLIEGCESLARVSLRHSSLTRLTLASCRRVTQLALHCPWLCGLMLEECGALKVASLGPVGIDELSLGTCSALCHVAVSSPTLRSLDLRGCGQLDSIALEGCSNLETLDATFCSGLKEAALVDALRPSPPLTKLVLSAVAQLGSPHLRFLSGLTSLRLLDLSYSDVTDLSALPALVPRLEVLTLASCHSLHHTSLISLLPSVDQQLQPGAVQPAAPSGGAGGAGAVTAAAVPSAGAWVGAEVQGSVNAGLPCLTELDVSYCALDSQTVAALLIHGTQLKSLAMDGCTGVTCAVWPALHQVAVAAAQAGSPWQPALQTLSLKSCKALRSLCLGLHPGQEPLKMYEPKQYPYLRPDIVAAEVAAINWQHLEVPGAADMDCGGTTAAALSANSSGGAPALVPFFSNLQNLRVGLSGLQVLALSLPSLTSLELNGCSHLRALELRCPKLQSLRSSWAPQALTGSSDPFTGGNGSSQNSSYTWPSAVMSRYL